MSDRLQYLELKRDAGMASAAELAELDADAHATRERMKNATLLIGGDEPGAGCLAVPYNALTLEEWQEKYADAMADPLPD